MSRFSDQEEHDEEMESAQSYEEEPSDVPDDSDYSDVENIHQMHSNFLAHLRSSDDPNARQLARIFQASMPGFEEDEEGNTGEDYDDNGDEGELGNLLSQLRNMRRRMFPPGATPQSSYRNNSFRNMFGDDQEEEVFVGSLSQLSKVRLTRIALTIQNNITNEDVIMHELEQLNSVLVMSSPEELGNIVPVELVKALLTVLRNNRWRPELSITLTRAIAHLLESSQSPVVAMFVELGLPNALRWCFEEMEYVDIAEHAVAILDRIIGRFPRQTIESGCVVACIEYVEFFNLHIQKTIMNIVNQACAHIDDSNIHMAEQLLPAVAQQCMNSAVSDLAVSALCQMVISVDKRTGRTGWINTHFAADYQNLVMSHMMSDAPNLPLIYKALAVFAKAIPQFSLDFLKGDLVVQVAESLTGTNFLEVSDPQQTLPKLLQLPKENLSAALQLIKQNFPYPNVLPGEPETPYRNESVNDLIDLTSIEPERQHVYCLVASRLAMAIYSASTATSLRELVLFILLQISASQSYEDLESLSNEVNFSSFLSSVVSPSDVSASLLIGGFEVAYELGNKLPHRCLTEFTRRGISAKVDRVLASQNLLESSTTYGSALEVVAKRLKDLFAKYPEYSATFDGQKAAKIVSDIEEGKDRFTELVQLIDDSSPLELTTYGIFSALVRWLADPARRPAVVSAITPVFTDLVGKTQDALSHAERLGVLSSSASNTVQSLASALTRPVNIRLHAHNDPHRFWTLRVQGIAAVEAIEDFYRTRIFSDTGRQNLFSVLADDHDMDNNHGTSDTDEEVEEHQVDSHSDNSTGEDQDNSVNESEGEEEEGDEEDMSFDESNSTHTYQVPAFEFRHENDTTLSENENAQSDVSRRDLDEDEFDYSESGDDSAAQPNRRKSPKLYVYIDGHRVYRDMSVVGAVFRSFAPVDGDHVIPRSLWTEFFDLTISETEIPESSAPPHGVLGRGRRVKAETLQPNETPASFGPDNEPFSTAIRLLDALWHINIKSSFCHQRKFVNSILTAKLNRQLEDPLVVVSSLLPQWTVDIVRLYPFLFPFETRYLFVQSTSFGYSRCMSRWQTSGEGGELSDLGPQGARSSLQATVQAIARTGVLNNAGRPVKQKFSIKRTGLFSEFQSVFMKMGSSPAILDIEFANEAGTGLGPTQEFYTKVSREFASAKRNMWRGEEIDGFIYHVQGLYPKPFNSDDTETALVQKSLFADLGRFIARALLDQRILDFRFNPAFFTAVLKSRGLLSSYPLSLEDIDAVLAQSLNALKPDDIESLELTFVLPGDDSIQLCPQGATRKVTAENLDEYRQAVAEFIVFRGVEPQIHEFIKGFSQSLPIESLQALLPEEISTMCGQSDEDWTLETLSAAVKADHGYSNDSHAVRDLLAIMSAFDPDERREFLQFTTGSPNLPIGGFKALQPPFTVVLKHPEDEKLSRDLYLPSVMTCANYLKLPEYSSRAVMARQLRIAVKEGSDSFPLS